VTILNKKASFEYNLLETYEAGMQLLGTEIKSIRAGKANLSDAYCTFINGELYIRNMHISDYVHSSFYHHELKRERKLLLHKKELKRLNGKVKEKGLTIIPVKIFISETGYAKLEIALAKGKKVYDKRDTIKERDMERESRRSDD
jgi:SsrA-binding protein